ncbi:MAG: S8 family serine peptidase [Deltaproteobacteria bacterium]|nr:S8 family serine peptidase [Deltaproteobacteria bacterium]
MNYQLSTRLRSLALATLVLVPLSFHRDHGLPGLTRTRTPLAHTLRQGQSDAALAQLGVPAFELAGGRAGQGVVLAIVDTGFDLQHPALRGRVAWALDTSGALRGEQPALETRFGGAVWSRDALRETLAQSPRDLPRDLEGHGTFVASLAAGHDPQSAPAWAGIAPEATLVLAAVGGPQGADDHAIVSAVDFALDRAGDLPVIVVLALASARGTHDGNTPLERALALRFAPPARRLLALAAGNLGARPAHQRAHIRPRATHALRFETHLDPTQSAELSVAHEGPLELALRAPNGTQTPWVSSGQSQGFLIAQWHVGLTLDAAPPPADSLGSSLRQGTAVHSAAVIVTRRPSAPSAAPTTEHGPWELIARGDATVDLYAQDNTATLPDGSADQSLTVPCSVPGAVVISATTSRPRSPPLPDLPTRPDGTAEFSGRGPDRLHRLRPDLAAPGGWVLAAQSSQAPSSPPSQSPPPYTLARGTSVATPIAAAALARLWSTLPDLSPQALVARATASSSAWSPTAGWGPIDLAAALAPVPSAPPSTCTLSPATAQLTPGEPVSLALAALAQGHPTESTALPEVTVTHGALDEPPRALTLGRTELRVRAHPGTAGQTLTVRVRLGQAQCERSLAIRPPPWAPIARAHCNVTLSRRFAAPSPTVAALCALALCTRRRRRVTRCARCARPR